MTDTHVQTDAAPARRSGRLRLILPVLVLLAAGGGFAAGFLGLLPSFGGGGPSQPAPDALPDIAFVPLDPIVVNLGPAAGGRHLRFAAQIEVAAPYRAEVDMLRPRVLDLLNGYLRAVDPAEFDRPGALVRLRAQMLRRIQIVTGEGRVRDLLVTEFVLS